MGALDPTGYTCIWCANNDDKMSFWRPNCPAGYVSLSDFGNFNFMCTGGEVKPHNAPEVEAPSFRCVHESLTIKTDYGYPLFESKGLGSGDGKIIAIGGRRDGIRVENVNGGGKDTNPQRRLSNIPVQLLYKDLTEVLTLSNPSAIDQKMSFSLQRGLESTRSKETTDSAEFRAYFSDKVGTGEAAKAAVNVEATASFGTTLLSETKVSQSDDDYSDDND
jgi:hypothetical protein